VHIQNWLSPPFGEDPKGIGKGTCESRHKSQIGISPQKRFAARGFSFFIVQPSEKCRYETHTPPPSENNNAYAEFRRSQGYFGAFAAAWAAIATPVPTVDGNRSGLRLAGRSAASSAGSFMFYFEDLIRIAGRESALS
jgi:hypothetical protein